MPLNQITILSYVLEIKDKTGKPLIKSKTVKLQSMSWRKTVYIGITGIQQMVEWENQTGIQV